MIRVAHIITKLEHGGAQLNTLYTVKNIDKSRFVPYLIYGEGGFLQADYNGCPCKYLVREISPIKDMVAFFEILSWLRAIQPDIVHTHSSKAGVLGRLAAWIYRVPVIIHTVHGWGFHDNSGWWIVWLERLLARITDCLIFVSQKDMDFGIKAKENRLIRSGIMLP